MGGNMEGNFSTEKWDALNNAYHEAKGELQLRMSKIQKQQLELEEWYQNSLVELLA